MRNSLKDCRCLSVSLIGILLSFTFCSEAAFASSTWSKKFLAGSTRGGPILETVDGGYVQVSRSYGGKNSWLSKLDATGNVLWQKAYGATDWSWINSVQHTADGGYVLAGIINEPYGWGDYGDGWVAKLDDQGNIEWQKTYKVGSLGVDVKSIEQTTDGGYVFLATVTTPAYISTNIRYDTWIVKLDGAGNIVWQKLYDYGQWEKPNTVLQTADGGYLAAVIVRQANNDFDTWLLRLDAGGNTLWQKTYSHVVAVNNQNDWVTSVKQTSDGGYILGGFDYILSPFAYHIWALKLDGTGSVQWQKRFNVQQNPNFDVTVEETADGGYALFAGWSVSTLIKLDNMGKPLWMKDVDLGYPQYIRQTVDGGFIVSTALGLSQYSGFSVSKLGPRGTLYGKDCIYKISDASHFDLGVNFSSVDTAVAGSATNVSPREGMGTAVAFDLQPTSVCSVADPVPDIRVVPTLLNFSSVGVGSSMGKSVTISNQGDMDLTIYSIVVSGSNADHFTTTHNCATVAASGSCVETVSFAPLSVGSKQAYLAISSNDPDTPVKNLSLTGSGIDDAPPFTTSITEGRKGNADWYVSDVSVTLTAFDAGSGVKQITYRLDGTETVIAGAAVSFSIGADGAHTVAYYAKDNAGNTEQQKTSVITLDKTPPTISESSVPAPNSNGWNNSDVTATFACDDAISGIATCTSPITAVSEGAGQTATGTAVDKAGNNATTSVTLNIDKTNPSITAHVTPAPNASGWHNTNVIVTFTCSDVLSGISSCPGPITVSSEGVGQVIAGTAVDKAGNKATATVTLNIDKAAALITATVLPAANQYGWHNRDVTVTFTCSDALSGIAFCPDPVTVTTEGAGQVVSGTAVDKAGNTATASVTLNIDKTPPALSLSMNPGMLWPPNHKMVTVTPSITASDANPGTTVKLVSVTSSEPDNGLGDGDTANDIAVNGDDTISLRAERSGTGPGRVYTITYQAMDIAGNSTTASATVTVPHDMR